MGVGRPAFSLDHVGDVHRHLVDLRRVVLLNVAKNANIILLHKIDGNTLTSETTRATDSVDVQLT